VQVKQIHTWFRNSFRLGSLLSLVAGIQLFVFSEQTDTYFAWTIQSSLTAATLGGFYFGTMIFGYLAARETDWARVRGPAVGLLVFMFVTLAATLLHLDKFHLASQNWLTRNATLSWLAIYVLFPIELIAAVWLQRRMPGADPERTASLPAWFRLVLTVHGIAGIVIALGLFFAPQSLISFWPWALTPLTARALSAWFFSFGALNLQSVRENDWSRVRVMSISYTVSGFFALAALLRYASQADLVSIDGVGYLIHLLVLLGMGVYGSLQNWMAKGS
jgi:hypothetical protein